ncbi:MAG: hypothetical protein ABGY41_18210, partial [Candidatus Poribacteria bacterium]
FRIAAVVTVECGCDAQLKPLAGLFDITVDRLFGQQITRELLDHTTVSKWNWLDGSETTLLVAADYGCVSNNGTKGNPCLVVDILGDWREEVIWRTEDNSELRIFTSTEPTDHRFTTLMHDPLYRLSVAWQNVSYNQPTQVGFYMGAGMGTPTRPDVYIAP